MNVNSSTLAAEHGVRDIGTTITVGVSDGKDARLIRTHGAGKIDLRAAHLQSHLGWESRGLAGGEVDQEGIALDRPTFREVNAELVVLLVLCVIPVLPAILKTLEGGDCAVVDRYVPSLELLCPAFILGGGASLTIGRLSAVGERNDVAVQGVDLQNRTKHASNIGNDAKWLVAVLWRTSESEPLFH